MLNQIKNIKIKKYKYKYLSLLTIAFAMIFISNVLVNVALAKSNKEEVNKIYHVYASGEFIGVVTDQSIVEEAINKKVDELSKQYEGVTLTSSSNITFIPEVVFNKNSNINDEKVVEIAVSKIKPLQQAYALILDGQVVTYLSSVNKVEEAINKMKLKYVTEDELQQVQMINKTRQILPELTDDQSRILNVTLSKEVTKETTQVAPEEVLSVDEAVTLLENGSLTQDLYEVQSGDVLGSIANKHGLSLKELLAINPDLTDDTLLKIGQQVNVTVNKPYLSVIVEKEINVTEEIPFETKYEETDSLIKGDTKVQTAGEKGSKSVTYSISTQNGVEVQKTVVNTVVTKEPVTQVVLKGTKVIPSRGNGQFVWPVNGGYISSTMGWRWGRMHNGIDIARPSNRTIKASDNGIVESVIYSNSGLGNHIIINHNNGYKTVYGHLASISVSQGQTVSQGQGIGVMGSTGDSTGIHLHFEIIKNGSYVNPLNYVGQ